MRQPPLLPSGGYSRQLTNSPLTLHLMPKRLTATLSDTYISETRFACRQSMCSRGPLSTEHGTHLHPHYLSPDTTYAFDSLTMHLCLPSASPWQSLSRRRQHHDKLMLMTCNTWCERQSVTRTLLVTSSLQCNY